VQSKLLLGELGEMPGIGLAGHGGYLDAGMEIRKLQAGRFAGHHAIDGITLLLERMLVQPDHADLLEILSTST